MKKYPDYQIMYDSQCDYVMSWIVYDKSLYGIKKQFKYKGKRYDYKTGLNESRIASFQDEKDAKEYIEFLKFRDKLREEKNTKMKKLETIGYVYSYVDNGDNADSYTRISKMYKTLKSCKRAIMLDAKHYAKRYGGKISKKGNRIEVEFDCDYYCLYDIHEVKVNA